jgi:hypothetical protein
MCLFGCVQVLQAVIRCDAGVYLTNESVCKAYQAAFMLGNLDAGACSNMHLLAVWWQHPALCWHLALPRACMH